MHITFRYQTLRRVEAILLSASTDRMRFVARDENDTNELHFVGGQWFSEEGYPVEIESLVTDDPKAVVQIWREARALTCGAAC